MACPYDKEEIYRFIDAHTDEMIRDIVDLIRVPSISRDLASVTMALELILDKAAKMGFEVSSLLGNRVGLVEMDGGDETVGILAHLDVVDVADDWSIPAFAGLVKDGMIWGRGAIDDKGPLVAALYAMLAVKSMGLPRYKKVQMILGTQEEVSFSEIYDYVRETKVPDYGFTPDGDFPAANVEKGYCDIQLHFSKSNENDGDVRILLLEAGNVPNSVPSRARAVVEGNESRLQALLEDYRKSFPEDSVSMGREGNHMIISASGLTVHSSVPEKGINAISVLCRFLNRLPLGKGGAASLVALIANCFHDDVYGKGIGLYSENEYRNGEFIHRNVISPTVMKTHETCFEIIFNIRNSLGTKKTDIEKAFNHGRAEYGYTIDYMDYCDPIYVNRDTPYIKVMKEAYEEITGLDGTPSISLGTSYAKAMPNIVCWGPVFPGEEEFCHAADERVEIDSLVKAAKIYARALAEMVFSPGTLK